MENKKVVLFTPYPFEEGQLIHIEGGPRRGDWKVIGVTERKVRLKCPISHKEFDWDRFCYFVQERTDLDWPQED